LPQELQEASAIVETIVLWGFVQAPGIVLLCKGKIFRVLGFLFLLVCEGLFIIVPILAQLGYAGKKTKEKRKEKTQKANF
jgi:hypothetical protein